LNKELTIKRQSLANRAGDYLVIFCRWSAADFASLSPGFNGSCRIVSEVSSADLSSNLSCFSRTVWVVCKITRTTFVSVFFHRFTSHNFFGNFDRIADYKKIIVGGLS